MTLATTGGRWGSRSGDQDIYLLRSGDLYDEKQTLWIRKSLQAVSHKYVLSSYHLEQLWRTSESLPWDLVTLMENSTSVHRWTRVELTLGSAYLESFLFQARSLLDVYMHYVCLVMNIRPLGKMGWKAFQELLDQIKDERFRLRAATVGKYFKEHVFSEPPWGWLLRELRDKIAHCDRLCPQHQNSERLVGVHLDWPTIRGHTFESLAQSFDNGMFELLRKTTPLLFLLEWKSEPYRPDLWDA